MTFRVAIAYQINNFFKVVLDVKTADQQAWKILLLCVETIYKTVKQSVWVPVTSSVDQCQLGPAGRKSKNYAVNNCA
jgi:hypothetical protein